MPDMKTIIAGVVGASVIAGAAVVSIDPKDTVDTRDVSVRLVEMFGPDTEKYIRSDKNTRDAVDLVLSLYTRRERGDEPRPREWEQADEFIDNIRAVSDNDVLRKADRLIEVHDGTIKYQREEIDRADKPHDPRKQ